ncbi:adenylyltransferase/cytidyltransferase family protein [Synoicihabitans lomoniglobus]|uniref:Adenylyltransferase/cytidyltransferase family protein n=1 Tax=Synoicihabitans lomoniglobus TaxID=2909285 RepID=A0AAF0I5H7_9BACT|nr:adenylyltransferase/cytidyltransferase family protein [Opitutaceae bacterium LMO-M01]WED67363.1 adenylyltransferase/cytidyltransferase family protein [Opitutaceae bacterium LMO-M01]
MLQNSKLLSLDSLITKRERLRHIHKTCVLTNGCFDLLHTGHLFFLQAARNLGDYLIVALNSDSSIRALKGTGRPVITETERAYALAALECVDCVLVFKTPDLEEEIKAICPDIYAKAGDYSLTRLHSGERAALETCDAKIEFLPFLEGFSTTNLIHKIARAGEIT